MRRVNPFILSSVSLVALSASPALAQTTQADQSPPAALRSEQEVESGQAAPSCQVPTGTPLPPGCTPAVAGDAITVTGSRIRRPNLESPLPVTSVGGQEFFETGNVSVGDKLAELPSIRSTFTQANSTRFLGTGGLNLLDLRGLGTKRTLVLVNGRRHVGGDVLSSGVSVDVNTIPTDMIERVDVVTGGNSAVYGSDAIAGVVNFVLKQDYDGIQMRGQGGISKYGDAGSYFVSGLFGRNFSDGRGNVALNLEYARRDNSWGYDRSWLHTDRALNDADPANMTSDGIPDFIVNPDFRSASFSNTGTIRFNTGQCGTAPNNGVNYLCSFIFQPNGDLIPQTGTRIGNGPGGQFVGGNGSDIDGHQVQISPQLDRYSANLIGHFDITPALVPFVEAKYSRTNTVSTGGSGPGFMTATTPFDPFQFVQYNRSQISINNPFLSPQARQVIIDQRALAGLGTTDATRFTIQEGLLGLGNRVETAQRNTFRIVAGLRGDIGNSWNYEISANYGQLKEHTEIEGNMDQQRLLLALDAVRDPATGKIVCRSQIDPSAAFGFWPWVYGTSYFGSPGVDAHHDNNAVARLAADVAACQPLNPLGGNISQAARDYVVTNTVAQGKTSQLDIMGFISGDSSKWFELPGGPIGVVLGAEYRENDLYYHQDEQVQLGYTFYNPIPTFDAPKTKVKEAFGEIRLPILKDLPMVHELEVSGAARVSDYNGAAGTVWAYNGNVVYSPVQGIRLRGNYARSVRAPNQAELFTPFGQNFSLVSDPCDVNSVGAGSANRAANCLAAGIPANSNIVYTSSLFYLTGGNSQLKPEKSDSWTFGGVITPSFLPGASLSVDYYNIKVKKVITGPSAQQILNACYDLADINNVFCQSFQRAGASGLGGQNGLPYGIIPNSLHVSPLNYAALKTRGVDVEVAYRHQLGRLGRIDTRLNWTHLFELTQFIDPTNPTFGDRIMSEMGDPQDAFNWNTSLKTGRFTFGYQMRYIGKQIKYSDAFGVGTYEDFFSFEGRPAQNPDLFEGGPWEKAKFYHDLRFGVDVGPKYNFYLGVDNATNVKPPADATGLSNSTSIYDVFGRFYYAGVSAKF